MKSTKEKINYDGLYKKRDKDDPRDISRRALENLYEQTEQNNARLNNLVDRYHVLFNDFSKFKREVISEKENSCQPTQD
tara:strand:+ start:253 stop:489 length:237 start_codon:yes stop_codon:yes gene_type:complete